MQQNISQTIAQLWQKLNTKIISAMAVIAMAV